MTNIGSLLVDAATLMLTGMAVVFIFLTILVYLVRLMSKLVPEEVPEPIAAPKTNTNIQSTSSAVSPQVVAAISLRFINIAPHSRSSRTRIKKEFKSMSKPLAITDVVLRDAHQSLFATRMRIEDMLPIAAELDKVGYWSLETWGGATFDSCIRFLGEDPWERLRELKKAMPNTPMQMLLRGQNLLGYRHYADDVVEKFVERAHANGMDVFRIFDAMNDVRNFQKAVKATVDVGAHAQGTLSYTTSPVHNADTWVDLAKR